MQQGPKLTATSPSEGESFGDSVALSSDGEVALVGAAGNRQRPPEGDPAEGAADVFARSAGVWTQTAKLTDGEHDYGWGFGRTVALSADGNTALIGAHGRAIIYYSGSAGWSEHHPALEADPYEDNAVYGGRNAFGSIVALSADGTRALIGASAEEGCGRYDNQSCSSTATVWAFTRQAEAWVREPLPLVREASLGAQVALSGVSSQAGRQAPNRAARSSSPKSHPSPNRASRSNRPRESATKASSRSSYGAPSQRTSR